MSLIHFKSIDHSPLLDDPNLQYQLQIRSANLCRLCHLWRSKVRMIPGGSERWGPSEDDIRVAGVFEFTAQVESSAGFPATEPLSSSEELPDESDGELCEQLEAVMFADEYRDLEVDYATDFFEPAFAARSSGKRSRLE